MTQYGTQLIEAVTDAAISEPRHPASWIEDTGMRDTGLSIPTNAVSTQRKKHVKCTVNSGVYMQSIKLQKDSGVKVWQLTIQWRAMFETKISLMNHTKIRRKLKDDRFLPEVNLPFLQHYVWNGGVWTNINTRNHSMLWMSYKKTDHYVQGRICKYLRESYLWQCLTVNSCKCEACYQHGYYG